MVDCTHITVQLAPFDAPSITFRGRCAWALNELILAGEIGCTPIQRPAPRWSQYIMMLRRAGVAIETLHKAHSGSYAGTHGVYLLRTKLRVIADKNAA
jgi:hypothetical protein